MSSAVPEYYGAHMRRMILIGTVLVLALSGCSDSDDEETAAASPTAATSPSPTASGSYVAQVNALCGAMIDKVMAVRGDDDGDGGGNVPTMDNFAQQDAQLRPVIEDFDAEVAAIPVSDADRAAAEAFDDYRAFIDADNEKALAAVEAKDQSAFDEAIAPSSGFEAKRAALTAAGIDCPAR